MTGFEPLVSEATALPTEPQPLPFFFVLFKQFLQSKYYNHQLDANSDCQGRGRAR